MNEQLTRDIIASGSAALSSFATAAKTTAEHIYNILVWQQVVDGIGNLIGIPLFLIITYILSKRLYKFIDKKLAEDSYSDWNTMYVVGPVFIGITSFIAVAFMMGAIEQIINPEYYALKFIFDRVHP